MKIIKTNRQRIQHQRDETSLRSVYIGTRQRSENNSVYETRNEHVFKTVRENGFKYFTRIAHVSGAQRLLLHEESAQSSEMRLRIQNIVSRV